MRNKIDVLSESDILSTLNTMQTILRINGKIVRVIRLDFYDREAGQEGTNIRFETNKGITLDEEEKEELNKFVKAMKW